MAAPVSIEVGDAFDGADLLRVLDRRGFIAHLFPAGDRCRVEVSSSRDDQRIFLAELGVALVRWSGTEGPVTCAAGELAWPPDGNATALAAALSAGDQACEAARLRLLALLLGSVWFELDRRRDELCLDGPVAEALGRELADAAYDDLLPRLGTYHGQSRFTTWAAKFGIHQAAVAARTTGKRGAAMGRGLQRSA